MIDRRLGWTQRASASWQVFVATCCSGSGRRLKVHEPGSRRRVAAWPLSQALWAASALGAAGLATDGADPESLWTALHWYSRGGAYLDNRPLGKHYFDDNAWLGLVAAQQALLVGDRRWWSRAAETAEFLTGGVAGNGGVRWVKGGDTLNACSTGSAGLLWRVIADKDVELPVPTRDHYLELAQQAAGFLAGPLRRADGLVADHQRADGTVDLKMWTYNQGLLLELAARSGDLELVDALLAAAQPILTDDELARQPAVFSCIWLRCLLIVSALRDPNDATVVPAVEAFLNHAWEQGRDERGLFSGVTRYDSGVVIDHAAITGLMAAYGAGPQIWRDLL